MKLSKWNVFIQIIFYLLVFAGIVMLCSAFDLGLNWDKLKAGEWSLLGLLTLIGFRLSIYFLPALIFWVLSRFLNRVLSKIFKKKIKLSSCYSIQFFTYSFLLAIYNLASIDYLLAIFSPNEKVEIFSTLDSFAFLLGIMISLIKNKKLPKEATDKFEENK